MRRALVGGSVFVRRWAPLGACALAVAVLPGCGAADSASPVKAPEVPTKAPVADGSKERPFDVIIVGAGMAGLTAAKTLKHAGRSFVVLEALDRIGGRGWVDSTFETPIDIGGAWIHAVETNPLTPFVFGAGLSTQPTDVESWHHPFFKPNVADKKSASPDRPGRFANKEERALWKCIEDELEENLGEAAHPDMRGKDPAAAAKVADYGAADKHLPHGECSSVDEEEETSAPANSASPAGGAKGAKDAKDTKKPADKASAKDKAAPKAVAAENATFEQLRRLVAINAGPLESGVELEKNSTVDAADFEAGQDSLIVGGFGEFVARWGREVEGDVRLKTKVVRIRREGGIATVETAAGDKVYGRDVLVTVSTGVLEKKIIAFEPDLPEKKWSAIHSLPMGVLNKVILQFDPSKSKGFRYPTDEGVTLDNRWVVYGGDLDSPDDDMAFVFRPAGTNVVIGFVGGERAKALEKDDAKLMSIAMSALGDMCQCDAKAALVKSRITHWQSSEISYGSYSAAAPSDRNTRAELAAPVDDQLYFAGEACYNSTYNGSFAAAYNSALQSSQQILEHLCKTDSPAEKASHGCLSQPTAPAAPAAPLQTP